MTSKKVIKNILMSSSQDIHKKLTSWGMDLNLKMRASLLYLQSKVWECEGVIPHDVRQTMLESLDEDNLLTYLTVDLDHGAIYLNYQGRRKLNSEDEFVSLIKDFGLLSKRWKGLIKKAYQNSLSIK